jgi:23S rRNA (guanosine2251-2'-O)-methyltransferase
MKKSSTIYLILHNIRSAENTGALFRTADAGGIAKVFLVGTTPAPIDRFGRYRRDVAKSALGAEKNIDWGYRTKLGPLLKRLKLEKFKIIAIEQSSRSLDYKIVRTFPRTVFILGNEVRGLPSTVLKIADVIAEIPMRGKKESLNVATAGGIAIFRMLNL